MCLFIDALNVHLVYRGIVGFPVGVLGYIDYSYCYTINRLGLFRLGFNCLFCVRVMVLSLFT